MKREEGEGTHEYIGGPIARAKLAAICAMLFTAPSERGVGAEAVTSIMLHLQHQIRRESVRTTLAEPTSHYMSALTPTSSPRTP